MITRSTTPLRTTHVLTIPIVADAVRISHYPLRILPAMTLVVAIDRNTSLQCSEAKLPNILSDITEGIGLPAKLGLVSTFKF